MNVKELAKTTRQYLKKYSSRQGYKFSIRSDRNSIYISILKAPFEAWKWDVIEKENELREDHMKLDIERRKLKRHEDVNHFHFKGYKHYTEKMMALLKDIHQFISKDQRTLVEDSDYGTVPTYYINISIGQWDKPFEISN